MGSTANRVNEITMNKVEALEFIKETWQGASHSLEDKIYKISEAFYSAGLDIAKCAHYIKATPAEFDAFLSLSNLDDEMIKIISKANPPKTTWPLLASGNDDEIRKALAALSISSKIKNESVSEFIYHQMVEVAGETTEQKISQLTGGELFYIADKAKNFSIKEKELKLLTSFAAQKRRGKVLSNKQIEVLKSILNNLADNKVVQRNSIDGDEAICDKILDALGR